MAIERNGKGEGGGQFRRTTGSLPSSSLGGPADFPAEDDVDALIAVARDPQASSFDIARLMEHRRPLDVRMAAAQNPNQQEFVAFAAAYDPSPIIRAWALSSPWLDEDERARLAQDPATAAALNDLVGH
jgi:hypothetical protein